MAKGKEPDRTELLANPLFRLLHGGMYNIIPSDDDKLLGGENWVPFKPYDYQSKLLKEVIKRGVKRVLIPKARQMGFSTLINMYQLDQCIWNSNYHSRIVDQNKEAAEEKLVDRCSRAWDHYSETFQSDLKLDTSNNSELKWNNGSRLTASKSGRGGTVDLLHVSELGWIDFLEKKRSDEILDGAFRTARKGSIFVESTAKGPVGNFYDLCKNALEKMAHPEDMTDRDFWLFFFAWHDDPRNMVSGKFSRISKATDDYIDHVEEELKSLRIFKKIGREQRLWYQIEKETSAYIEHEQPSLLSECWGQKIEGAIYADSINKGRSEGRVGKFPHRADMPVYTIWDLGAPENTRCVFFQKIMGEFLIIDAAMGGYDEENEIDGPREPADWGQLLRSKGYHYGAHILPHDGTNASIGGVSFKTLLQRAGLNNIVTLRRRQDAENLRISETLMLFNRIYFNTEIVGVKTIVSHLERYHRKKQLDGLTVKDKPEHDFSSHFADAFSSIKQADDEGKLGGNSQYISQKRNRAKRRKYEYSAFR